MQNCFSSLLRSLLAHNQLHLICRAIIFETNYETFRLEIIKNVLGKNLPPFSMQRIFTKTARKTPRIRSGFPYSEKVLGAYSTVLKLLIAMEKSGLQF